MLKCEGYLNTVSVTFIMFYVLCANGHIIPPCNKIAPHKNIFFWTKKKQPFFVKPRGENVQFFFHL